MAERGVNDVNPFSFKAFVGKDKKVSSQKNVKKSEIDLDLDTDDIFGVDKTSELLQIKENVNVNLNLEKTSFSLALEVEEGGGGKKVKQLKELNFNQI